MSNEQQDFVKLYNPKNAKSLTQEQIDAMMDLSDEQIKTLAEAYPNSYMSGTYLILYDKNLSSKKNQMGSLGTWQNLYNLRSKGMMKNYLPWTFRELWRGGNTNKIVRQPSSIPMTSPQDITNAEIAKAAGIVRSAPQHPIVITPEDVKQNPPLIEDDATKNQQEFPDLTDEAKKKAQKSTTRKPK